MKNAIVASMITGILQDGQNAQAAVQREKRGIAKLAMAVRIAISKGGVLKTDNDNQALLG